MGGEWKTFRLGDVCSKIGSGATPRGGNSVYLDRGEVALIRSQNIYNDGFRRDGLAYLTEHHAAELSNVEVAENDVLLNITGDSVARSCQVSPDVLPARVNQHVAIIRSDPTKLWPRLLRYHLVSPATQAEMLSLAGAGATRSALTKGMIESFEVLAPVDVGEQRAIAHILGTLDDKIELNRWMNETLESIARAIFKSWFEDREAAHADATGWKKGKVDDVATLSRESLSPSNFPDEVFDHYSIPAFDERRLPSQERGDTIQSNKLIVSSDCILLSKLNPRIPRVWLPSVSDNRRSICSTEFFVAISRPGIPREWLYSLLSSVSFLEEFTTFVTGTSGSHQRVKHESLLSMSIQIPPKSLLDRFALLAGPVYARIAKNLDETQTLTATRDSLLPKLLTGKIQL